MQCKAFCAQNTSHDDIYFDLMLKAMTEVSSRNKYTNWMSCDKNFLSFRKSFARSLVAKRMMKEIQALGLFSLFRNACFYVRYSLTRQDMLSTEYKP